MIALPPSKGAPNGITTDEVDDVVDETDRVVDIVAEETVCAIDTVYVPVEPVVPDNCAVIIVY